MRRQTISPQPDSPCTDWGFLTRSVASIYPPWSNMNPTMVHSPAYPSAGSQDTLASHQAFQQAMEYASMQVIALDSSVSEPNGVRYPPWSHILHEATCTQRWFILCHRPKRRVSSSAGSQQTRDPTQSIPVNSGRCFDVSDGTRQQCLGKC